MQGIRARFELIFKKLRFKSRESAPQCSEKLLRSHLAGGMKTFNLSNDTHYSENIMKYARGNTHFNTNRSAAL